MEVDRHNFGQYLPSILDRMSRCVFMSIDNELSGLGIKGSFHFFDTQAERYEKICANALQYPIIQFGLTLFDMNADNGKLDSTCYKFSVFDRHTSRQVAMDTASIKFLSDNNFNFNKLFRDGISWINWHEEKLLWDKLQTDKALLHEMPDHYPDNVKRLAKEQVLPQYHRFWNDCTQKVHVFEPFDEQTAGMLLSVVLKEHEIRKVHSKVQDRLLSSQIYEECVAYVSPDNRLTLMKCLKPCNDRNSTISPILIDNVGFSYIIQQMSRCRRPIVGHNILLDMMHIIDQFIMPLPHEYNRFRTWLHDLFPAIYDTKHMARVLLPAEFGEHPPSLQQLFSYFRTNEFDLVCQLMLRNNPFSTENETRRLQFHDAGYDSFITGLCFVALQKISDQGEPGSIWNDERIRNCLYNSHSHDIAYISPEKDIPIIRKNVFHVKFSGKVHSLRLMFNKLRTAVVTPLDDQQVLVAVLEKEIKNFCKQFQSCSDYQVTRYSEYVHTKRIKEKRDIKRMIQFQEETISSASCDYGHRGICERKINRIAELLRKKGPTTKAKGPIYISLREPKKNRSNKSKHETVKRFKSEHSPSMENGRVEKSVTTIEFNSWIKIASAFMIGFIGYWLGKSNSAN